MKRQKLPIHTDEAETFVDITGWVQTIVKKAEIQQGMCHLFVPHTTAGVTVNENCDPDVTRDMLVALDKQVPKKGDYRHAEGNSHAHIKASMMGHSLTVPVEGGRLLLGQWQGLYFTEFDGPRSRQVIVTVTGC
ncbi:secondary thiamine-phosphate synthase enzyme YjbQ [Magnetococcus sp. PR-3]|uniref:secondary thiamine-phosphate synthase enzyme YjbQ n=1 Tax=Magnetococcus sp. PR-3 TaxID=3120355 RepID=UPI002FCE459A